MLLNLADCQPPVNIAVQHRFNKINIIFAQNPGYAQFMVEDLIDAIEWVLFIDEGVEQDTECPYVLFLSTVGFALEDFGRCII